MKKIFGLFLVLSVSSFINFAQAQQAPIETSSDISRNKFTPDLSLDQGSIKIKPWWFKADGGANFSLQKGHEGDPGISGGISVGYKAPIIGDGNDYHGSSWGLSFAPNVDVQIDSTKPKDEDLKLSRIYVQTAPITLFDLSFQGRDYYSEDKKNSASDTHELQFGRLSFTHNEDRAVDINQNVAGIDLLRYDFHAAGKIQDHNTESKTATGIDIFGTIAPSQFTAGQTDSDMSVTDPEFSFAPLARLGLGFDWDKVLRLSMETNLSAQIQMSGEEDADRVLTSTTQVGIEKIADSPLGVKGEYAHTTNFEGKDKNVDRVLVTGQLAF